MTRREFSIALGGVAFSGLGSTVVLLQAVAGARLPESLAITTTSPEKMREGLWELRTYRGVNPWLAKRFASVFPHAGIHPLFSTMNGEDLTYLIQFEDLAARDRAWTRLNSDPGWTPLRRAFRSYGFGLYRVERARSGA